MEENSKGLFYNIEFGKVSQYYFDGPKSNIDYIIEGAIDNNLVLTTVKPFKFFFHSGYFHPNDLSEKYYLNLKQIWFEFNNKPKYSNKFLKSYIKFKYGR